MSSYDQPQEFVSADEFYETIKLVRVQVAVPTSVLVAIGTTVVCTLFIKPGIGAIAENFRTPLTPDPRVPGGVAAVAFLLELGVCILLASNYFTRATQEALVHGAGLRLAAVNWLIAAWAVAWTLTAFVPAAGIVAAAALLTLWMHATSHGQRGWVPSLIALLLALLLALTLQSGAVALKWGYSDVLVAWRAAGALGGVHLLSATWEAYALQHTLALANEVLVAGLLYPSYEQLPAPVLGAAAAALALHPLALGVGHLLAGRRSRRARIRLEEEVEAAAH